jgi:hypothetical protein
MQPHLQRIQNLTRRHFLRDGSLGLGSAALAMLGSNKAAASGVVNPQAARDPQFKPRAKRVIYLHLTGSPPHLDLYDYKPELVKRNGQLCPDEFVKGKTFAFTSGTPKLLGTPRQFARHGKAGIWLSDALTNLPRVADELCVIKSMYTDQFNHAPAELLLYTGSPRPGRPSMGSWVTYGLGSENENLPGFVVLISSGVQPNGGKNSFGSGFLPSVYQGVQCRSKGDPVLYSSDPPGMDRSLRRESLDALRDLNEIQARELGHPETLTRIAQYELAFRMQASVPELTNLANEPAAILDLYGPDARRPGSFAANCLLARRLVERGVRCVQLYHRGWDNHGSLPVNIPKQCQDIDQAQAALILDLKQRGLLDETLIVWAGEFGRTVYGQGGLQDNYGRDHHGRCFSIWMAGGGVKPGFVLGETDDYGYNVIRDPVHVHDLNATILHCLGIDHERLTFRFQGRDYRLTDVQGNVVREILT